MSNEQEAIARAAERIYEARFPDHGTRHGATPWGKQTPEVQAVWIACARALLAASPLNPVAK